MKIKKKDTVVIIAGKDRGRRGEVLKVLAGDAWTAPKVVVAKANIVTKHQRPSQTEPGGIQKKEAPIAISNVMLLCPKCEKPIRPRLDKLQTGERVRVCGKCKEVIV